MEDPKPSGSLLTDTSIAEPTHADNLVIVDLDSGGIVMERRSGDPIGTTNPLIKVNKSSGLVTFVDSDNNAANGTTAQIRLPDASILTTGLENRALRALYRTKNSFAVQVLKAPSEYSVSATATLGAAQYYVGGSDAYYNAGAGTGAPTRIYFPRMDVGRKVTVGRINYFDGARGNQAFGQDFIIRQSNDAVGLPFIDLRDFDTNASTFDYSSGNPVSEVRGASLAVRVSWNPDFFHLGPDPIVNLSELEIWGRSYRRTTNETFLDNNQVAR